MIDSLKFRKASGSTQTVGGVTVREALLALCCWVLQVTLVTLRWVPKMCCKRARMPYTLTVSESNIAEWPRFNSTLLGALALYAERQFELRCNMVFIITFVAVLLLLGSNFPKY